MKLAEAQAIADRVQSDFAPHCERIAVAGSIRRQCPEVGDIEVVAIPLPYDVGLFESGIATVVNHWPKLKGELGPACCYTQRRLPEGINLNLFLVTPETWGLHLAIRTGSARFSHEVLAKGWVRQGCHSTVGRLVHAQTGTVVSTPEESDLFHLAEIEWIEPEERSLG